MKRLSIAEALREGIAEEMRRDPAVFCMGEDIAVPGGWGGAFTVTLGLEKEFPDRMLNTPIAELGFFGAGVGAAIMGMRPIVDVQYGDFLFLAMDQIGNNAAKLRYMSGGTVKVPLVMRAPVGATGRGSQHAQSMERYFTGVPGLKVVAVSNAYDAKGLLKAAVRDDNPVLIFEHKLLYGSKGARTEPGAVDATSDVPEDDYTVPLDRAAVRREGTQVTILAWLLMLHHALQAALELAASGIDCEVIDVRSLAPIDYATIGKSVEKTGRVVIVEEGPKTGGVSGEIAAGMTTSMSSASDFSSDDRMSFTSGIGRCQGCVSRSYSIRSSSCPETLPRSGDKPVATSDRTASLSISSHHRRTSSIARWAAGTSATTSGSCGGAFPLEGDTVSRMNSQISRIASSGNLRLPCRVTRQMLRDFRKSSHFVRNSRTHCDGVPPTFRTPCSTSSGRFSFARIESTAVCRISTDRRNFSNSFQVSAATRQSSAHFGA